jgi:hypothetical protein
LEFAKFMRERSRDAAQGVALAAAIDSEVVQNELQRLQSHDALRRITA